LRGGRQRVSEVAAHRLQHRHHRNAMPLPALGDIGHGGRGQLLFSHNVRLFFGSNLCRINTKEEVRGGTITHRSIFSGIFARNEGGAAASASHRGCCDQYQNARHMSKSNEATSTTLRTILKNSPFFLRSGSDPSPCRSFIAHSSCTTSRGAIGNPLLFARR
jgi:hypothetical protein